MDGSPPASKSFLNANCRLQYYVGGKVPTADVIGSCGPGVLVDNKKDIAGLIGSNNNILCQPPWQNLTSLLKPLADGSYVHYCEFLRPFTSSPNTKLEMGDRIYFVGGFNVFPNATSNTSARLATGKTYELSYQLKISGASQLLRAAIAFISLNLIF